MISYLLERKGIFKAQNMIDWYQKRTMLWGVGDFRKKGMTGEGVWNLNWKTTSEVALKALIKREALPFSHQERRKEKWKGKKALLPIVNCLFTFSLTKRPCLRIYFLFPLVYTIFKGSKIHFSTLWYINIYSYVICANEVVLLSSNKNMETNLFSLNI